MEIDEEPAAVANTCSRESRRQCTISFSVLLLIASIMYVATTIVYTSYTMVIEMDNEVENRGVKVIGMYDSCANPTHAFNVVEHGENMLNIGWHEQTLTQELLETHLYVFGTNDWKIMPNLSIAIQTDTCNNILLIWKPV